MKGLKYLFFGLTILFLGACSYQLDKRKAPEDLIPQDTFTMVLQEIMIVESYVKHQQNNVNAFSETLIKSIDPIFEKYKVDSARYSNSMEFYASRQEKLIEIYSQIQDSLTLNTVEYENE